MLLGSFTSLSVPLIPFVSTCLSQCFSAFLALKAGKGEHRMFRRCVRVFGGVASTTAAAHRSLSQKVAQKSENGIAPTPIIGVLNGSLHEQ